MAHLDHYRGEEREEAALLGVETVEVPAVAYEAALDFLLRMPGGRGVRGIVHALARASLIRRALDYTDPAAQAAAVELLQAARGGGA